MAYRSNSGPPVPASGIACSRSSLRGLDLAVQPSVGNMCLPGAYETLQGLHGRNADKVKHILDEKQARLGDKTVFRAAEAALIRLRAKKR